MHASEMYAKNLLNFLTPMIKDGEFKPDWDDEVIADSTLTRDGEIKHAPTRELVKENHHDRRFYCTLYLHAGRVYRLRSHRRVPVILHTPLMSGSNFVHGIVLVGAMVAMGHADTTHGTDCRLYRCHAGRG